MSRNPSQVPPAIHLIISALLVLNVVILKVGSMPGSEAFSWLFVTVPLFLVAVFAGKSQHLK